MTPITLRLRELREAKGWTQRDLAEAAHVRIATVSRLENHIPASIDLEVLDRLARALGVDPGFLLARVKHSTRGRKPMTTVLQGWHTKGADCFHNNYDCEVGRQIPADQRVSGNGGLRLCEECAAFAGPGEWTAVLMGSPHPPAR